MVKDTCFGFPKNCHMVRDCPMTKTQIRESNQAQESSPSSDALKRNHFYVLKLRGDQEGSPDVVTCMFYVFSVNVYAWLDPCVTLDFCNSFGGYEDWCSPQWISLTFSGFYPSGWLCGCKKGL